MAATRHDDYPFSDSTGGAELARLVLQARILRPSAEALLRSAGVGEGMRVLDLGSGAGDLSFLAAELVGPSGEVVGLDRSPEITALAGARARRLGIDNVRFVLGGVHEPAPGGPFDAIIGRLVLMYVADPAAVLRTQAEGLRPGGVVAPVEMALSTTGARPEVPSATRIVSWAQAVYAHAGADPELGPALWRVVREAGLRPLGTQSVHPHFLPGDADGPAIYLAMVEAMVPVLERAGVATAGEIGIETVEARLTAELAAADAVLTYPAQFCAWGVKD